jgi:hypothetical protein
MAADDVRPKIYIGTGTPRILGKPLQYAEYRTRDRDSDGNPIRHPWCERFYNQDRSADSELHQWLISVWMTVNDTCDWIVRRLTIMGAERGIVIPNLHT